MLLSVHVTLTLTLGFVGGAYSYWCYDCSSILGQCNDGRRGVKTINLMSCDGGQCTKIQSFDKDGEETTLRFCYEYRHHPDGCETTVDEELETVTTRCYCSEEYCNAAPRHSDSAMMTAVVSLAVVLLAELDL